MFSAPWLTSGDVVLTLGGNNPTIFNLYFALLAVLTNQMLHYKKHSVRANVARYNVSKDKCIEYLSLTNTIFHICDTLNLYIFDRNSCIGET